MVGRRRQQSRIDYTETKTTVNGLEGTNKTGYMSDNRIVLGTEGGPTDRPSNTFGIFSGGGKKNATADVSNNNHDSWAACK